MMNKLWTLILSLTTLVSFGQTEIQELQFKLTYNYSCFGYSYDITLPLLKGTIENDMREVATDRILSIYNHIKSEIPEPSVTDLGDCPAIYQGDESREINYAVHLNTDSFLSILINDHHIEGNGGHGGGITPYCFNIDLMQNQFVTMDSLFSPANKKNVLKLAEAKFNSTQDFSYEDDAGNISLMGINISDTNLIIHYNVYNGSSLYVPIDIELPLTDIKKYMNKKYLWLCRTTSKMKR